MGEVLAGETQGPREVGLDHLTMLDVPPPDLVSLAAQAGFASVGLRIAPVTADEHPWPMMPGSPMLTETAQRCADTGVVVLDVEVHRLGTDPEPVLEAGGALGARFLNVLCDDPDTDRFADRFADFTRLALACGVRPVVEFMAYRPLHTLADAAMIARRSGGGGVLLDTLHIHRCGASSAELSGLDPALLSYLQVCDAQAGPPPDPVEEARQARLLPGEGELQLTGMLSALPSQLPVAVEAPGKTTLSPAEYAARARRTVDALLGGS
jgi:sugar phosphate isomerase/epimerase